MNKEQRQAREQEIFDSMPRNTIDEVITLAKTIEHFRLRCEIYDNMLYSCEDLIEIYNDRIERLHESDTEKIDKLHARIEEIVQRKKDVELGGEESPLWGINQYEEELFGDLWYDGSESLICGYMD